MKKFDYATNFYSDYEYSYLVLRIENAEDFYDAGRNDKLIEGSFKKGFITQREREFLLGENEKKRQENKEKDRR